MSTAAVTSASTPGVTQHGHPLSEKDAAPPGEPEIELEFEEEPLGLPADHSYGYAQVGFGEYVGSSQQYQIIRKLAYGTNSNVWLARDMRDGRYVSIKALKGYATRLVSKGLMQELEIMQRLTSYPTGTQASTYCVQLRDHFTRPGTDPEDGEHLCLVMDVYSPNIYYYQCRTEPPISLPLIKRILQHSLMGLAHLHRNGIAHTDFKASNLLFTLPPEVAHDLDTWIGRESPRRYPPTRSLAKEVEIAVSQPMPLPSPEQALKCQIILSDFGNAQFVDRQVTDDIMPLSIRAPEVLLGGKWDTKVDIWAFGCMAIDLFTSGSDLFEVTERDLLPLDEAQLGRMMVATGERFKPENLAHYKRASQFFDMETGRCLAYEHGPIHLRFETIFRVIPYLEEPFIRSASDLLRRCIRLDPKDRSTAEELLEDPFFEDVTV